MDDMYDFAFVVACLFIAGGGYCFMRAFMLRKKDDWKFYVFIGVMNVLSGLLFIRVAHCIHHIKITFKW